MTKKLFTTTAAIALIFAATPISAQAFDESTWNWDYEVEQDIEIDLDVDSDLAPTGNVGLEQVQRFNGDIQARTEIYGDTLSDDAGDSLPDTITVDTETPVEGNFTFTGTYDANSVDGNVNDDAELTSDIENFEGEIALDDTSEVSVQPSSYSFNGTVDGTVTGEQEIDLSEYIEQGETLDAATEMGSLRGAATAIANYNAIETETASFFDLSQIHTASNTDGWGVEANAIAGSAENPVTGAVDLSASAISNYLSIQGDVEDPNNMVIGDLSQDTNANVLASAFSYQDISGYNNMGGFDGLGEDIAAGTVANLSATAIGNYSSFQFGPTVDLGPIDDTDTGGGDGV